MNKLYQKIERVFCVFWGLCFLGLVMGGLSKVMENKESVGRLAAFFDEDKDIDVLLFGSSHVRHGIFPMELWRDYGIVSYNLASNGDTIPVAYWKLVMALEYKKPDIVVMDIYDLWPGAMTSESIGQVHASIDAFPLSMKKIEAVQDLYENKEKGFELICKYSTYHTRWTELTKKDFVIDYGSSICKGALPLNEHVVRVVAEDTTPDEGLSYDNNSLNYLIRMIEVCQSENIEILLINTGYDANKESQLFADSIPEVAKEYDINYVDFTRQEIIDFATDLHSTGQNTHVNSSGARKLTSYLGDYLVHTYHVTDRRSDEEYADWQESYGKYVDYKAEFTRNITSFPIELTLLSDSDFSVVIYIKENSALLKNSSIVDLLGNILPDGNNERLDNAILTGNDYVLIVDNLCSKKWESTGGIPIEEDMGFGRVNYGIDSEGKKYLYIQDSGNMLDFDGGEPEAQIFVINKYTAEIVSKTGWKGNKKIE